MNETKILIEKITEGIQEKKGKNIVIADLTNIGDTICKYLVICQGNSPSQITAIVDSIKDFTRKGTDIKPFAIDGLRNAEWELWIIQMCWYTYSCPKPDISIIWKIFGRMPS